MLPTTESVNPDTMQTGELERTGPEEAPPHASMTVTRDSPLPAPILAPPLVPAAVATATEYKFKNDNDATDTTTSSDVEADLSDGDCSIRRPPSHQSFQQPPTPTSGRLFPQQSPTLDMPSGMTEHQTNESVRSWLQRITAMQQEIQRKQKVHHGGSNPGMNMNLGTFQQQQQPSRVVKYQDLPYMGEMTLDNSKPRRGRKPKKADICHLIYKNYGTIFPGTPKNIMDAQNEIKKISPKPHKEPNLEPVQRTNVQNRIISSLLEKRLTQESLRNKELLINSSSTKPAEKNSTPTKPDQDEPLNLCIRDLNQLKIRLLRKHGNVYASDSVQNEVKSEPASEDDDVEFVDESPSPEVTRVPKISPAASEVEGVNSLTDLRGNSGEITGPGGYVYWPNAGVFIHPMALHSQLMYYQRLAGSGYPLPGDATAPPSSPVDHPTPNPKEFRKLVPKHHPSPSSQTSQQHHHQQQVSHQEAPQRMSPASTEEAAGEAAGGGQEPRVKRGASERGSAPTKRKRSAIFIPPIPAENQTNPATEVSICKFKFTGGAKPSLQEKKMLSVDSGGNFRYYSGTGDKSMRGYEFFPRETLQQQAAAGSSHGSGTGAFLQASGEKIPMLPPPSDQKNLPPDFMFSADTPLQPLASLSPDLSMSSNRHRKRKTRKSLQREKLEQTFKEKGFLIQTQQLESAEGATYCKFRQLRKFTRYLFRSWKDYLPGSVRELHETERADEEEGLDPAATASVIVAANSAAEKEAVSDRERRSSDLTSV